MLKKVLKKMAPEYLIFKIRRVRRSLFGADDSFKGMNTAEIFNQIYIQGSWGRDKNGNTTSGTGSHDADIVRERLKNLSISV